MEGKAGRDLLPSVKPSAGLNGGVAAPAGAVEIYDVRPVADAPG